MSALLQPLRHHAAAHPNAIALAVNDTRLTWQDMIVRADALAAGIADRTPPGGSVAIDLPTSIDAAVAFTATAMAGRRSMLIESNWPPAIRAAVDAALPADIVIDATSMADLLTRPAANAASAPPTDHAPLMVGFTSGSTGMVKGYERTHGSWARSITVADAAFPITANDRVCAPGTLSFSLFAYALMHGLNRGASVRLAQTFRPRSVLDDMQADATTVLFCVPTQATMMIDAAERRGGASLDQVRLILSSGQKWPDALTTRAKAVFPNAEIIEFYGASETSFISYTRTGNAGPTGSVGRPFDGVDIAIREDAGRDAPIGTSGRLWVRSDMVFTRYVMGDAPECRRDGDWITVGDHGWMDAGGFLYLQGREQRMLVTSGVNLYPEVLEAALAQHPDIADAAIVGLPDPVRGKRIVAALTLTDAAQRPDPNDVASICRDHGGASAVPRAVHIVDPWPRTPGGKTDFEQITQLLDGPTKMPLL